MSRPAAALRIAHSTDLPPAVHVGDIVRTGENRYPHYRVIAISGDRAWIRDVQYCTDHVVRIDAVHLV